jgi:hypothetical protein
MGIDGIAITAACSSGVCLAFSNNVLGALVLAEPHELGMAQMVFARPLQKFEPPDEFR